jgi:hypothetical protein
MKTFELTGDSEELILEKFKDGSVELSIEYEIPSWESADCPAFVTASFTIPKEQVSSLIEFLTKSLEGK